MRTFVPSPCTLVRHAIAAAVVASVAASLATCASPVTPDYTASDGYTDSLIAHAILKDSHVNMQSPTVAGGVNEQLPRVDSPGPGAVTAPTLLAQGQPAPGGAVVPANSNPTIPPSPSLAGTTTPATAPATNVAPPLRDNPVQRGLDVARLNAPEPVINLSLQEAIARAMKNSLSIKLEGYNPAIKESLIVQAEAVFDPVVFANSQWQNLDDPSLTNGLSVSNGTSWLNQIGIRRLLPSGAQVQVSTEFTYRDLPGGLANAGPFGGRTLLNRLSVNNYQTNIAFQVTQPLLRGFGNGVNEANIYLAQRDQRIALSAFRQQAIKTVADVEDAYWTCVQARTNVDILERLVRASEQTYQMQYDRIQIDATKASLNQALSALYSRRGLMMRAQRDFRIASDKLKSLLNDPEINLSDNILINPTDKPVMELLMYSTADCIETALRQRTELQQARLQVEKTNIVVQVSRNDLLPKLDLVAGLQTNGLDSSFDQAFSSTVNGNGSMDFNAGFKLEFPLGNRAAEGELRQHQLERQQAITNIVNIAQTVVLDVKTQLGELLTSYALMQEAERERQAAALAVEGTIEIEDIRPRTPEFLQTKLQNQAELANAEQNFTNQIINYNRAIMHLEQAKGTLLEFNRIALNRPPVTQENDDVGKWRFLGKSYLNK